MASNGQEGVELMEHELRGPVEDQNDVVLMDKHMPEMDGPSAISAMRAMGYRGLIIGLTGDAAEEDQALFLASGADFVLTKPMDVNQFDTILCGLKNKQLDVYLM